MILGALWGCLERYYLLRRHWLLQAFKRDLALRKNLVDIVKKSLRFIGD